MLIFWFSPRGEQTLLLVIALAFLAAAWQVCCLQRPFHREICRDLRGDRLHLVEGVGSFYRLCIHMRIVLNSFSKEGVDFVLGDQQGHLGRGRGLTSPKYFVMMGKLNSAPLWPASQSGPFDSRLDFFDLFASGVRWLPDDAFRPRFFFLNPSHNQAITYVGMSIDRLRNNTKKKRRTNILKNPSGPDEHLNLIKKKILFRP